MAQAIYVLGVIVGPTLGPPLGGYIVDNYSWPYIFYINIPVGVIAALLTIQFVKSPKFGEKIAGRDVDWLGIALLVLGVIVALTGITAWHFRIALGLNGVGWNFLFVGATTLLTTTYRPAERGKAQAFNDFMVFGMTSLASLMASIVLEVKGWAELNYIALALVLLALAVIGLYRFRLAARS